METIGLGLIGQLGGLGLRLLKRFVTKMSTEQYSDLAPERDSDSEQDSQFSDYYRQLPTDVTKILI